MVVVLHAEDMSLDLLLVSRRGSEGDYSEVD